MDIRIANVSQELAQAELALQGSDMQNVAPLPKDRQRQLAERALVKIRYANALARYQATIEQISREQRGPPEPSGVED